LQTIYFEHLASILHYYKKINGKWKSESLNYDRQNQFQASFRQYNYTPEFKSYWVGTKVYFSGNNAAHFYKSIKIQPLNLDIFDFQRTSLARFDINYLTELKTTNQTESIKKRPVFYNLIENQLKEGDCLIITKIDWCSRNTLSFLQLKSQLSEKQVHFRVLELPEKYFKESPSDKLVSTSLAAIAEFETARRLERQLQGIEAAKKKNKYKGSGH